MGNEVVKALLWKSIQTQEGFREELFSPRHSVLGATMHSPVSILPEKVSLLYVLCIKHSEACMLTSIYQSRANQRSSEAGSTILL